MNAVARNLVGAVSAAAIGIAAGVLAVLPAIFLWVGLDALGARFGLWVGDPNSNDGEEYFAWPIGLVGMVLLVAGVVALSLLIKKRVRLGAWVIPCAVLWMLIMILLTAANILPPLWQW